MKKSRYTVEQIAFALKQLETGTPVAKVIGRMSVSEQTFYRRKNVYGGLGVGELRRVKQFVVHVQASHGVNEQRSCLTLGANRGGAVYVA